MHELTCYLYLLYDQNGDLIHHAFVNELGDNMQMYAKDSHGQDTIFDDDSWYVFDWAERNGLDVEFQTIKINVPLKYKES